MNGTFNQQEYTFNAANHVVGWNYDAAGNLIDDISTYDPWGQATSNGSTPFGFTGELQNPHHGPVKIKDVMKMLKYFLFFIIHILLTIGNIVTFFSACVYYGAVRPAKFAYYVARVTGVLLDILEFPIAGMCQYQ